MLLAMTGRQEHVPAWKDGLAVTRRPFESMSAAHLLTDGKDRVPIPLRGGTPTAPPPRLLWGAAPLRAASRESGSTVRHLVMLISNGSRRRRRNLFLTRQQSLSASEAGRLAGLRSMNSRYGVDQLTDTRHTDNAVKQPRLQQSGQETQLRRDPELIVDVSFYCWSSFSAVLDPKLKSEREAHRG